MANSMESQKRKTLAVDVSEMMKRRIINGKYKVGEKLPTEPELMEFFGVGRSTVREAMRVLAQTGYVSIEQGRGTFVKSVDPIGNYQDRLQVAGIKEIREVREIVEVPAVRLAAERRLQADMDNIRKYYDGMVQACKDDDLEATIFNDVKFHVALAKASRNKLLYDLYRSLSNQVRHGFEYQFTQITRIANSLGLHENLMKAVGEKNPDKAEAALMDIYKASDAD